MDASGLPDATLCHLCCSDAHCSDAASCCPHCDITEVFWKPSETLGSSLLFRIAHANVCMPSTFTFCSSLSFSFSLSFFLSVVHTHPLLLLQPLLFRNAVFILHVAKNLHLCRLVLPRFVDRSMTVFAFQHWFAVRMWMFSCRLPSKFFNECLNPFLQ